jgi:PleD family two-component response regulator
MMPMYVLAVSSSGVDHFKRFNDTRGHEAGDRALQAVAGVIAETVRATDVVHRYGGEESQPGACLTISVGISTLEAGDASALKTRADEALDEAKAGGRNRAVIA